MVNSTLKTALIFCLLTLFSSALSAQTTADYLVNWVPNPEGDITGYIIYRSLYESTGYSAIDSVDGNTHSYLDTDLPKGVRYYYRLIAKNSSGERSTFSNPVSGMTVPEDADPSMDNLCRITTIDQAGSASYDVNWSSSFNTIGFVQWDADATLDSMTTWDDDQYSTSHMNQLENLIAPRTYYLRAVSYDDNDNMIISDLETLEVTGETPAPVSAPLLSIYPVPYNPGMGNLFLNNLPEGGSVTVFNGNGLEVWRKSLGTETSLTWDGTNTQGSPVMSGVYYVIVKNATGAVIEKRPIMIVH